MSTLPRIKVSANGRFLATEQGAPFFWLGDTAWELFHRLTREEAALYFANRESKRFNVIQAVVLAEMDGLGAPNAYGHYPFQGGDPAQPDEGYFSLVDEYIQLAEQHNLYMGLLPTWGDKVLPMWGLGPQIFTPENAYRYGKWIGRRYRSQKNIIWILGGDRPAVHEQVDTRPVWKEMALGIREGSEDEALFTYHPMGGRSSGEWLHEETWLDVNMMQSGHGGGHDVPVWEMIARDYTRQPAKPVLDGEPNYEDHPVNPWPVWDPALGYYNDYDVRKQLYRSVFAGGCGVTYGHHSIWQFYDPSRSPINHPYCTWQEALDRPGASQVRYLRELMESRPYVNRIPDQELLNQDPGTGGNHIQATRDVEGTYAFIYLPVPDQVSVRLDRLRGTYVKAHWFNPRTGVWTEAAGSLETSEFIQYQPPTGGPDWVLVLDSIGR